MTLVASHRALVATVCALLAVVVTACGNEPSPTASGNPPAVKLPGSASPGLRDLARDANLLLDGDTGAFEARLEKLRGDPVVVNQWASWCGPCRSEFPFFQRLARKYAGRVGFLGVNSQDSRGDAEAFLREFPVPFPHYYDKDASVARVFDGGRAWPTTAFYNAAGDLTNTHIGAYADHKTLDADIRRYAIDG